jgi:tetratricopeptide (TPR) repeat protein
LECIVVLAFAACVLLAALAWSGAQDHDERCARLKLEGLRLFKESQLVKSQELYEAAIREAEASENRLLLPNTLSDLADVSISAGNVGKAQKCLERALKVYREIEADRSNVGKDRYALPFVQAETIETQTKLARVLIDEQKLPEAASQLEEALAKAKSFWQPMSRLADLYQSYALLLKKMGRLGDFETADVEAKIYANLADPAAIDARIEEAQELMRSGKYSQAENILEATRSVSKQIDNRNTLTHSLQLLGICQLVTRQLDSSEATFQELSGTRSKGDSSLETAERMAMLGLCLAAKHNFQLASKVCHEAVAKDDNAMISAIGSIVPFCIDDRQIGMLAELLKFAIQQETGREWPFSDPELPEVKDPHKLDKLAMLTFFLAETYQKGGYTRAADKAYQVTARLSLNNPTQNSLLGTLAIEGLAVRMQQLGKYKEAEPLSARAVELAMRDKSGICVSELAKMHMTGGLNDLQMKNYARSEKRYKAAIKILNSCSKGERIEQMRSRCFFYLAYVLLNEGKQCEAKQYINRALVLKKFLGVEEQSWLMDISRRSTKPPALGHSRGNR